MFDEFALSYRVRVLWDGVSLYVGSFVAMGGQPGFYNSRYTGLVLAICFGDV